MRILLSIVVAMLMASAAYAADFGNPLVQGQVMVKAIASPSAPGATETASLGASRTDTDELVFCADAAPGASVEGMSDVIVATSADIFIVFHAYPGPGCTVLPLVPRSAASADRYRVVFGPPGQPLLLESIVAP